MKESVEIAGVPLTHPDRLLYPDQGITKRALALFYQEIADWILPHLVGRPLSLMRCPQGQGKACFYQKHASGTALGKLKRVRLKEAHGTGSYVFIEDLSGLITLVQLGVLEIHPWGARVDRVDLPDRLTIDLDPAPRVSWKPVVEAARAVREQFASRGLKSFLKTSGGKGLHVVVPLAPKHTWDDVRGFAKAIAEEIVRRAPGAYTANPHKAARRGKIFIDYLRNARGATTVAAYSTRARAGAPVSTPLAWDELGVRSDQYAIVNLPRRLAGLKGDPWDGYLKLQQGLAHRS